MKTNITVGEWIAMFRELGLNDQQMHAWHRLFESRHPEAHQGFLQWLGLTEAEIDRIRSTHR